MNKQVIAFALSSLLFYQPNAKTADSATIVEFNEQVENSKNFVNPCVIGFNKQFKENLKELNEQIEQRKAIELEQERIKNVWFNSYNLRNISGISYEEMREVLSESHYSNFAELSDAFVEAERKYKVNAFALVAIAGLESGWNQSDRANNGRNNIVGMAVYDDGSHGTTYESKYSCIMDLARQLDAYYLTESAQFFNGYSTSKVNMYYSTNPDWYKNIDKIGDELVAIYNQKFRNGGTY